MATTSKNKCPFSLILASACAVHACGGSSGLTSEGKKASAPKASVDDEDETADQPVEVAGAFLDDGSGETSRVGVAIYENGKKKPGVNPADVSVKLMESDGSSTDVPVERMPEDSPWHLTATVPSSSRKSGELNVQLQVAGKIRHGRLKMGLMKRVGTEANAARPKSVDSAASAESDDAALTALPYAAVWQHPSNPVVSFGITAIDFSHAYFPKEACKSDGTPNNKWGNPVISNLTGLQPPKVESGTIQRDACFDKFSSVDIGQFILSTFTTPKLTDPDWVSKPHASNCYVVKSGPRYYVVTGLDADRVKTFVAAHRCSTN